jgi:hypothetical protein
MCRNTDAPSSWVCLLVTLLGVRVAVLAMVLILDDVIGWTVTVLDGGFLAMMNFLLGSKMEKARPLLTGLDYVLGWLFSERGLSASDMPTFFQHFIHAAWIDVVMSRDSMLERSVPVTLPDIHSVIER